MEMTYTDSDILFGGKYFARGQVVRVMRNMIDGTAGTDYYDTHTRAGWFAVDRVTLSTDVQVDLWRELEVRGLIEENGTADWNGETLWKATAKAREMWRAQNPEPWPIEQRKGY